MRLFQVIVLGNLVVNFNKDENTKQVCNGDEQVTEAF